MIELALARDFEASTEEDWCRLAAKALGGAPWDTLRTPLYEGFAAEPLYLDRGGDTVGIAPPQAGWHPVQRVCGRLPTGAKENLEDDLRNGIDRFWLGDGSETAGDYTPQSAFELEALCGPPARQGEIALYLGSNDLALAAIFASIAPQAAPHLNAIKGCGGLDPLSSIAMSGEIPALRRDVFSDAADAAFFFARKLPQITPYLVSDRAWHQAGGSAVHELGFALAAAVSYWRELVRRGMSAAEAARLISFALAAGPDLFLTVAKFRSLRALWARALDAANAGAMGGEVLAYMPHRSITEREPEVNLLRGSAAAFGAAIGGADGVVLLPFDAASEGPARLAHRLARNTSFVLRQEAQIGAVGEAGRGSYYIEDLTARLCASAWALFRDVEAAGGLLSCLETGFVTKCIGETRAKRDLAVGTRADKITGVSVFANLDGAAAGTGTPLDARQSSAPTVSPVSLPPAGSGERFAALVAAARDGHSRAVLQAALRTPHERVRWPLPPQARLASGFETLRHRSDLALLRVGSRPPLFVATVGSSDGYFARANWVRGFFAAGGIETLMPDNAGGTADGVVAAFKESPAPAVCLCGSNAAYTEMSGTAARLKAAGAIFVYLAGPASALATMSPDDVRAVDRVIYEGCNALHLLEEAHGILRVAELSSAEADDEFAENPLGRDLDTSEAARGSL